MLRAIIREANHGAAGGAVVAAAQETQLEQARCVSSRKQRSVAIKFAGKQVGFMEHVCSLMCARRCFLELLRQWRLLALLLLRQSRRKRTRRGV